MEVLQPATLEEALAMKAATPQAVPLAGGTDLMVEINFGRRRPEVILDLTRVDELKGWTRSSRHLLLGSGVTYTRIVAEVAAELPGLALASRTVGSPQIRNRGTVGGNLGTASPAGDALPPLLACDADVRIASSRGSRIVRLEDFLVGPKRNALAPDELITAVAVPVARGPQQFSKIGTRNAMVIAVSAFALAIDTESRSVGTGIGSAGPVVLRAREAERFIDASLAEGGSWESGTPPDEETLARFGELVAEASQPIDDVRGTAAYRRHALGIMAQRTFRWAWAELQRGG
ncbi:MAG TPA: FAD binding domain-containing protein [Actinomycetota bacterium]|nr:FAD binding domain-containing protein [Actinomycetota bacterium]